MDEFRTPVIMKVIAILLLVVPFLGFSSMLAWSAIDGVRSGNDVFAAITATLWVFFSVSSVLTFNRIVEKR